MIARIAGILLALAGCAGIWWASGQGSWLRGTILWELRYLVFLVASILWLSLCQWVAGRIAAIGEKG